MCLLTIDEIRAGSSGVLLLGKVEDPDGCTELRIVLRPVDTGPSAPAPLTGIGTITDTGWRGFVPIVSAGDAPFPCSTPFRVEVSCASGSARCELDPAKTPDFFAALNCCPSVSDISAERDGCVDPDCSGRLRARVRFRWTVRRNGSVLPIVTRLRLTGGPIESMGSEPAQRNWVWEDATSPGPLREYEEVLLLEPGDVYRYAVEIVQPACAAASAPDLQLPPCACPGDKPGELQVQDLDGNDLTDIVQRGGCIGVSTVRIRADRKAGYECIQWTDNALLEDQGDPFVVLAAVPDSDTPAIVTATLGSNPCVERRSVSLQQCMSRPGWCGTEPDCRAHENTWVIALAAWIALLRIMVAAAFSSGIAGAIAYLVTLADALLVLGLESLPTGLTQALGGILAVLGVIAPTYTIVMAYLAVACFILAIFAALICVIWWIIWRVCCAPRDDSCIVLTDIVWALTWGNGIGEFLSILLQPGGFIANLIFGFMNTLERGLRWIADYRGCTQLPLHLLPSQRRR